MMSIMYARFILIILTHQAVGF